MVQTGAPEGDFQDYWERFAASLKQLERSPLTIKNYRSDLKAFAQWLNTSEQPLQGLTKVSAQELKQYQEFLLTQQQLKPRSVNRRLGALKNFYTWLQQEGLLNEQLPHMPVPLEDVSVTGVTPLSPAELRSLLEAVQQDPNHRDRAMLMMLVYTGVRAAELCQLRWADVEMGTEPGQLLVRRVKSHRDRKLILPREVRAALLDLGYPGWEGSQAPVFVGQRGSMTPQGVQNVVRKYAQKVGLEKLTPHQLRHTCFTLQMERGGNPRDVARWMGLSAEALLRYYEQSLPVQKAPL